LFARRCRAVRSKAHLHHVLGERNRSWLAGRQRIVAKLDGSGNVLAQYVYGSKPNVPDYYITSAGVYHIFSDHLGSPRLILDPNRNVVEVINYDEFGNVTSDTAPGTTPFGFAGGLYDKDTGLVRFGARDYDPSVGRWTSKDPLRFRGGYNLYVYAANDPINKIDSRGLNTCDAIVDGAGAVVCGLICVPFGSFLSPPGFGCAVVCAVGFGAYNREIGTCNIPSPMFPPGYEAPGQGPEICKTPADEHLGGDPYACDPTNQSCN
jgi:RHS repeat-associated protein